MSQVNIITPRTIVLQFRQEHGDPDYGSCLWATFSLDLDAYGMTILSDCGSYGYKWVPTPKSESFLHLLARVDSGYPLDKISSRSIIDGDATFKQFRRLIEEAGVDPDEPSAYGGPVIDMERLQEACCQDSEQEIHDTVTSLFKDTPMENADPYDVWSCVEKDFPLNAKKIASVFQEHIAPMCAKLDARDADGPLADLPQYHFERDAFADAFREVLGDGGAGAIEDACRSQVHTPRFLLACRDEEYYIVHKDSGTMVNWYKHLERTNACNKPDLSLQGLKDLLSILKEDLDLSR